MVKLDRRNSGDKNEWGSGFPILPYYSFSKLMLAFSHSTWLGRCVYVVTHLAGSLPFANVLVDAAMSVFSTSSSGQEKVKVAKGKSAPGQGKAEQVAGYSPRSVNRDFHMPRDSRKQSVLTEDASNDIDAAEERRLNQDLALARILQEHEDAKEARRLQQELESENLESVKLPLSSAFEPADEGSDFALAKQLQAEFDVERDPEFGMDAYTQSNNNIASFDDE